MAQSKSEKTARPASVAVIGAGYRGRSLVRNYAQIGALRAICDKDASALAEFRKQYPDTDSCPAVTEVLNREDIQGVAIATPAETHFDLAREALLAGKHVYVEKPLVPDEKEAAELIALARSGERILMVGHLLQYHPAFLKLRELAAAGGLGRINYIYSHRLNQGKIRREGDVLGAFAPHDISMILSLAGEEPASVSATGGSYLQQKIPDVSTTHLEFPSGLRAHIFVSWLHPFREQKLVVAGDRKMAVFDDTRPWGEKLGLYSHQVTREGNMPVPAKAEYPDTEEADPLNMACRHFLRCIASGQRPRTDGDEGLRVLKILKAGQRSLDGEGRKIHLGEAADKAVSKPDPFFAHPSAVIDDKVKIGAGTKIWHFSHVLSGSRIGSECNIGQNVVVGPDVIVGNQCKIQNNVSVYKGVTLEDGVFCGPSMVFTNVYNPRAEIRKMDEARITLVKQGATIGANATVVCGVTIGCYAFVGAGAVVIRNIPDYALVVGNPGRQVGWVCECGERLNQALTCVHCGKQYRRQQWNPDGLEPMPAADQPAETDA